MNASTRVFLAALSASLVLGYIGMGSGAAPTSQVPIAVSGGGAGPDAGGAVLDPGTTGVDPAAGTTAGNVTGGGAGTTAGGGTRAVSGDGLECAAGRNGGKTDTGVTAKEIRLAATVVLDGPAASLLSASPTAMKAVSDKVNSGGGICGRLLSLTMVNDSFDSARGQQYIQNFINDSQGYLAIAVAPSAEGLGAAILAKDINRAKIPVVGSDGMRKEQYEEPFVWPVATATVSTMRIIASYAYKVKGARTFAIVYDNKYKFGREGAEEFKKQVQALGGKIIDDRPLDPERSAYASEAEAFNNNCKDNACDAVVMLLLPDTAQKWMARRPAKARVYTAGAQTLFTDDFAKQCAGNAGLLCHGLAVWTGYNPPIDRYAGITDVSQYVNDVKVVSPNADVRNQFMEGAYLGMSLLVEALKKVGPNLTRERLRAVLDTMDYGNQITSGLTWRPGKHNANIRARAFSMVVSDDGRFVGWRDEQTDWVRDPAFGG